MLICPGMASPKVNSRSNIFPVTVMLRAIANETMLAKSKVKNTEKTETITEFLKGVIICPSANKVRKLLRLNDLGNARGLV